MSALGKKLRQGEGYVLFWCPGCNDSHMVSVNSGIPGRDWGFNGDSDAPVFSPSVLVTSGHYVQRHERDSCWCTYNAECEAKGEKPAPFKCYRCHSFVGSADGSTPGRIQFLADCTHALAGQTVDLSDYPLEVA